MKFLRDSFAFSHKAISTFTPENMLRPVRRAPNGFAGTNLELAVFGATHGTTAQGDELISTVQTLTEGVGVDHAFVCINPAETLLPAFRATAKAGNVVVTAITPDTVKQIDVPPLELFATQKAIMGAVYGFQSPRLQIPELLALYRRGDIKLKELITRTYRLDEINRGYADLDAGKNLRGVVVFD